MDNPRVRAGWKYR